MIVKRRSVLVGGLAAAAAFAPLGRSIAAVAQPAHALSFHHLHTGERLEVVYREHGAILSGAVGEINRFLRDFRTGEVHDIDIALLDTLTALHRQFDGRGRFEVISGYRSPKTNEMLRSSSAGVAKKSLHLSGRAIDVRLTGTATKSLRDAARALQRGGVGYYPQDDFVHVDTGRVRSW